MQVSPQWAVGAMSVPDTPHRRSEWPDVFSVLKPEILCVQIHYFIAIRVHTNNIHIMRVVAVAAAVLEAFIKYTNSFKLPNSLWT